VDIYPTLTDLCNLKGPGNLAGTSLAPMLRDPKCCGKEFTFSFHPRGKLMGRAIRTEQYRLVYWTDTSGKAVQVELYDHQNDPEENVNVASENVEIVQKLIKKLKQRSIE
jgi:arylsulfatase A-like enzyme